MRNFTPILLLFLCLLTGNLKAQDYLGLEGEVPANWSTTTGASLAISDLHYKLGSQSLRWDWVEEAQLVISNPQGMANATQTYKGGLMLWIYNQQAIDKKLLVQFGKDATVGFYFEYNLNFTGWRACWIRFDEDMQGPKNLTPDWMKITAPTGIASGSLYFDRMKFPDSRISDRVTPDAQLPNINPDMNQNHWGALWHWYSTYNYDLPLAEPSSEELASFTKIEEKLTQNIQGSKPNEEWLLATVEKFNELNIVRDEDRITGRAYVADDEYVADNNDFKMSEAGDILLRLAKAWFHTREDQYKQMFYDLFDHLTDQGLTVGSGMGTNHHYGYSFRDLPRACFLMREATQADGYQDKINDFLYYWCGIPEFREPCDVNALQGVMDAWNTMTEPRLIAIMFQNNGPEKLRDLKSYIRWTSGSLHYSDGTIGGIKADGSGFHHGGLYPAYSTGGFSGVGRLVNYFNDTQFSLSDEALSNLSHALYTMRNYSNLKSWGFGICGRHPLGGTISNDVVNVFGYLAKTGNKETGEAIDKKMAAAYLRLESRKTDMKTEFKALGIETEKAPQGFFPVNYGALGIHRRNNWMVSLKGFNKYVWSSEIYTHDNRFGRYISYGTVQIMGSGDPVSSTASGFSEDGWDWNRFPGATSIHLPLDLLESPTSGTLMAKNDETFAGASHLDGENGVFGMILHEYVNKSNFTPDHRARKSVFCFDDRIVCLGSNISNSNAAHSTETTLFQCALDNDYAPVLYGNPDYVLAAHIFPFSRTLEEEATIIMDNHLNAYYIPGGQRVTLRKQAQTSRHNKSEEETQGNFAVAYLDHGMAPSDSEYEYAILVNSHPDKAEEFGRDMQNPETAQYSILQKDANAHVVTDRKTGITGYVIFEKGVNINQGQILRVEEPCLVMTKSEDEQTLKVSVTNPDLNFGNSDYTSNQGSQMIPTGIWLKGEWSLPSETKGIRIQEASESGTLVEFDCIDAKTLQVSMKSVNNNPSEENAENDSESTTKSAGLSLFPNPGNGAVTLRIEDTDGESYNVAVYNPSGAKVYEKPNCQKTVADMDLTHLPNGVYLVHLTFLSHTEVHKLIIRH